jgi:hypothetical protein
MVYGSGYLYYLVQDPSNVNTYSGVLKRIKVEPDLESQAEPLNIPSNISASPSNSEVTLSWGAVTTDIKGASVAGVQYVVCRSTDNLNFTQRTTTSLTRYTDTGLLNGQKYYYKIRTINADSKSNCSDVVCSIPETSISLVSEVNGDQICLKWTSTNTQGVQTYIIERSSTPTGPWTEIARQNSLAYCDVSALCEETWFYRVSAVYSEGVESSPSNVFEIQYQACASLTPTQLRGGMGVPYLANGTGADSITNNDSGQFLISFTSGVLKFDFLKVAQAGGLERESTSVPYYFNNQRSIAWINEVGEGIYNGDIYFGTPVLEAIRHPQDQLLIGRLNGFPFEGGYINKLTGTLCQSSNPFGGLQQKTVTRVDASNADLPNSDAPPNVEHAVMGQDSNGDDIDFITVGTLGNYFVGVRSPRMRRVCCGGQVSWIDVTPSIISLSTQNLQAIRYPVGQPQNYGTWDTVTSGITGQVNMATSRCYPEFDYESNRVFAYDPILKTLNVISMNINTGVLNIESSHSFPDIETYQCGPTGICPYENLDITYDPVNKILVFRRSHPGCQLHGGQSCAVPGQSPLPRAVAESRGYPVDGHDIFYTFDVSTNTMQLLDSKDVSSDSPIRVFFTRPNQSMVMYQGIIYYISNAGIYAIDVGS